MPLTIDLSGRRALVTGGGQGVGRGIALGLAAAGATVIVNDLDPHRAEAVVGDIEAGGGVGTAAVFDVTDFDSVCSALEGLDAIDVLVNNAGNAGADGFGGRGTFAETGPDDWEPFLRVNLYGAMHCTRAVLPAMIATGWGRVITIVSDAGRVGDAGGAAYSAAKAGAAGLTHAVARESGRYGITANNISLGTMRTPATEAVWADPDNEMAKGIMRNYIVRRPGDPDDAAHLVAYLAGDHAAWITGQTIPLNGGFSLAL